MKYVACDHGCLYTERSMRRLKGDPPRCIKHGSILEWVSWLSGMSEPDARRRWKKVDPNKEQRPWPTGY